MKKIKDYYNEELNTILEKYITEKKYGLNVEFIKDVFQRRAFDLGFNNEEIEKQVINFNKNCRKISYLSKEKMQKSFGKNTFGMYMSGFKQIFVINDDSVNYEDRVKVFIHEIYHAISSNKNSTGLMHKINRKDNQYTAINEIFNECASNRVILDDESRQNKIDFGVNKTFCYPLLTFLLPLMSNVLGISEKKLLKAGVQTKDCLIETINREKTEMSANRINEIFEMYSQYAENMFDENYNSFFVSFRKNQIIDSFWKVYDGNIDLFSEQIDFTKMNDKKYVDEYTFRYKRILSIIRMTNGAICKNFGLGDEEIKSISDKYEYSEPIFNLSKKILKLNGIAAESNEVEEIVEEAKSLELSQEFLYKKLQEDQSDIKSWGKIEEPNFEKKSVNRFGNLFGKISISKIFDRIRKHSQKKLESAKFQEENDYTELNISSNTNDFLDKIKVESDGVVTNFNRSNYEDKIRENDIER